MNKVFKVIWNHATQTWTAVSELGHAKGKTKSKKIVKLTALAGAVLGVVGTAQAAVELGSSSITIKSDNPAADHATKGINNINIGTGANTYRNEGLNAAGEPIVSHDAIAIGSSATGTGDKAVAIGKGASATKENGIAIGFNATNQSIDSVAIGREATSSKDMDVAIGKQAKATGGESLAFGSQSKASGQATIAVGKESNASGSSAVAAGYQSAAAGDNAVAVGKNTTAGASNAIAVGLRATATGTRAIATGAGSSATGEQSLANGFTAKASGNDSIALGNAANASAANATAIGTGAVASDNNAVALGAGSTTKGAIAYQSDTFFGKRYVFAGGSPSSVVSIGSDGKERQLVNVAAGRINGQSTDAVNGSQLYAAIQTVADHHWTVSGNTTSAVHEEHGVYNKDIVDFQNGNGTKATIEYTAADQSSGNPAKTVVKYHANIVNGDNTEVVYNADGSVKINAKVAGGTDTTAAVTTNTPNALTVTNTTANNVTTYNVNAKTGSISTTTSGAATYDKNGDSATGGDYGSRLTNVSTVTDIVNNVSWHLNSSPVSGTNGKITEGSDTQAADVKASNTVNINAGKNIEIKRNGTTIEISSTAGEKGDTGATGAKGDTGAAGAKGADGKNAEASVVNNGNGTHTVTIVDGNGQTTSTVVKDGKNAEADVKDNGDGTHTVTIKDGNGNTSTTIVKDGATGADGKNAKADVKDNGDGTHTITIIDGDDKTTSTIVKDGKNAQADVKDNGNGTHTVTIVDGNGKQTVTTIRDGKDGKDGKAIGKFGLVDETGTTDGTIEKDLNKTIQIKGDAGTKVKVYDKQTGKAVEKEVQNIFVKKDGDALKVSLNPDVTVNSVTTNELKAGPVTINNNGIDAGNKQIKNVADGKDDTDAVNVRQLRNNISNVNNRINKVGKEARGGIAGANAAAGLPQVYIPGKSMVAASAGTFKGESAVAVGYSRSSDNGKVIFKLQGNANTQGDVGGSVGVGYQW